MMHGGGRAGVHVGGWQNAGYNLEDLESVRQAAKHMFVDGVAMREHHHYDAWCRRANERVPLTKRGQRKLQKVKAPGTDIRVDDLIRLVRHQRIK